MPSNQTSKEEIEAKAKAALEDDEAEVDVSDIDIDDDEEEEAQDSGEENDDQDDEEELEESEEEEKKPETPSIEDRYRESSREAKVLYHKQKQLTDTVEQAAKIPEPTEAELKAEYSDWDDMTATEQRFAKENLINKRRFSMIHETVSAGKKIDEWNEKVDDFVVKGVGKYPRLTGKEADFKNFASKPTRIGLDFDDLVKAFLFDATSQPKKRHKGSLLESGSAGKSEKKKSDKISAEQASALRRNNHKLYQKLVKKGKIKIAL